MIILAAGAFGRCLGHQGKDLMNGISALIKATPQICLDPLPYEDTMRSLQLEEGLHQAGALISDFQPPEL